MLVGFYDFQLIIGIDEPARLLNARSSLSLNRYRVSQLASTLLNFNCRILKFNSRTLPKILQQQRYKILQIELKRYSRFYRNLISVLPSVKGSIEI